MHLTIGLTGAHRTGKTTLAEKFAESAGVPFVRTSTSQIMRDLGVDPKADVSFAERIRVQHAILDALGKSYQGHNVFVSDRTPLDAAAYLMADVQRENVSPEDGEQVRRYIERCYAMTNRHFGLVILVPPGIAIKEEEGKAPGNVAYVDHIHYLIQGMLQSKLLLSAWSILNSGVLDLDDRVKWLSAANNVAVDRIMKSLENEDQH